MITGTYRATDALVIEIAPERPGYRPMQDFLPPAREPRIVRPVRSDQGVTMSRAGYWPSTWPVECGGNHRPKTVAGPGLDLAATDRLVATTRRTGRWPVMFVQRDEGELYLQGTTQAEDPSVAGWVERVDPVTLAPLASSGDLPAGDHEWCGSVAVHRNGDLYTVNGSYLHRLRADCSVVAELRLPIDHAHNGLLLLGDGSIVTKDIRLGDRPSTLTVCDPDLAVLASVELPEASMGRIATVPVDPNGSGDEVIYVPGSTRILRYRWDGSLLTEDRSWRPRYRRPDQGGLAWDVTVVDGRVWLMDNGSVDAIQRRFSRIPTLRSPSRSGGRLPDSTWNELLRAISISVDDPEDRCELAVTEHSGGWVIAPPLVHQNVLVAWDTCNSGLMAFDVSRLDQPELLWFQPFRPSMQPILFTATDELVTNDFRVLSDHETSDDLVVLDVRTGQMKARVPTGATRLNGMFLCPGWDRDVYYCSSGTVAWIRAEWL